MITNWIKLQYLRYFQDRLIFKPHHQHIIETQNPTQHDLQNVEDLFIDTSDGEKLHLWHYQSVARNAPTCIMFHGNTGSWVDVGRPKSHENYNRHYRLDLLKNIANNGVNFVAATMRGYGKSSDAAPSQEAFSQDLEGIIQYLHDQNIPHENLIIMGESLGAAIAYMLAEILTSKGCPPKLLVAIAPFSSMTNRVIDDHPKLSADKVTQHLRHPFDSIMATKNLSLQTKIALFHGSADMTTASYHSDLLFDAANSQNLDISLNIMQDIGHINWDGDYIIKKSLEIYNA